MRRGGQEKKNSHKLSLEDDDEEDVEIKLSPSGSVLMAAPNPYDKMQRIREANSQLKQIKAPPTKAGKVRFNEKVILYTDDYNIDKKSSRHFSGVAPGSTRGDMKDLPSPSPTVETKSSQNKILLINVPTGFSEDLDESPSDDGDEVFDETAFRWGCDKDTEATFIAHEEVIPEVEESEPEIVYEDASCDSIESIKNDIQDLTGDLETKCSIEEEKQLKEELILVKESKAEKEPLRSGQQTSRSKLAVITRQDAEDINKIELTRPKTAPSSRRLCSTAGELALQHGKLPTYNGLRSEYGLSAEQLLERKKKRLELSRASRREKEKRYLEEKRRQKENEQMFTTWLVRKKKEAALKYTRKRQQNTFYRLPPAPTYHLDKMGILRRKVLSKKEHSCYSLDEFFKHAKPHEQKTYRIYLGLCVE